MNKTLSMLITTVLVLSLSATHLVAQVGDQERIIDVAKIGQALQDATHPIGERMENSLLSEKFATVNELLGTKDVNKEQVVQALKDLGAEINSFTDDWDSGVTAPLWEGQQAIGNTINRVRGLLARGRLGAPTEKTKQLVQSYDQRLAGLAQAIQKEKDTERKAKLRLIFENVLALRQLVEQTSRIDLEPANQAVYAKIVNALTKLEEQLTAVIFQVERVRVVLTSQSDFIAEYVSLLEGLLEAEALAGILKDMQDAGAGIPGVSLNLAGLVEQSATFTKNMEVFAGKLADSITEKATAVEVSTERPTELSAVDIDEAIRKYAAQK